MNRRERWQKVLDAEMKRWSEKSYEELRTVLSESLVYQVEFDSEQHQVEITTTSKSDPDQAKDKGIGLTSTAAKCGRDVASPSNAENG